MDLGQTRAQRSLRTEASPPESKLWLSQVKKKTSREGLYHSVLLARIDGQELGSREGGSKRTGDPCVVDRLRGQLERRTDWLRREGKWRGGQEMRLDNRGKMVGA